MRIVKDEYVYIVKDEYVDRGVESWRMNIRGLSVKDKYVNKLEKYCEVWICKQRGRIKKDEYENKLRSRILRDEWRENWTSSRQKKAVKWWQDIWSSGLMTLLLELISGQEAELNMVMMGIFPDYSVRSRYWLGMDE